MSIPRLAILAGVLCLALPATSAAEEAVEVEAWSLDDFRLGEQVAGPPLRYRDLEGRIVVAYHWCVSCPISTGGFPYVNELVRRFAPRGVQFVGVHVRRPVDVAENDVVYMLERLRPAFPVVRLGWDRDWPAGYLPWAVVFDPRGTEVFAANVPGIEDVLEKLVARCPDPLVGGPYEKIAEAAGAIASDRARAGRHLGVVRELAAGGDEAARAEAKRLLACVQTAFDRRVATAEEDLETIVERAHAYAALAKQFEGDPLGERAAKRLGEIRETEGYAAEAKAWAALEAARTAFRRLPPPGYSPYHPTEMHYRLSTSPVLRDRRTRMIAELRLALEAIVSTWPDTQAADAAGSLLFEHDVPELDAAAAKDRLERATALLEEKAGPYALREARLLLYEVQEGWLEEDDTAAKAEKLLASLAEGRAEDLAKAETLHRELLREVEAIRAEVSRGGSALPKAEAERLVAKLKDVVKRAGRTSDLARRIRAYGKSLLASYDGPPHLGIAIDGRFPGPGVRVARVDAASGASNAGLRVGDVLMTLGGTEIAGIAELRAALAKGKPGQELEAEVLRAGTEKTETVTIVLGRRP
jgi:hypothetical protein